MRHHKSVKKFGRVTRQRTALMRGLVLSLLEHGRIHTTESKAKALRPLVEKLITKAKQDTVANRRLLAARLGGTYGLAKLFVIGTEYQERAGGYTRITKTGTDKAGRPLAVIEFVR